MTSSEHGGGKPVDVVERCERLLESWSFAEPDAAFFDANHDAVMARIGLLKPGVRSSEDLLLEAPLPQVPGEPAALLTPALSHEAPRAESRERGGSLRELAERALGDADGGAENGSGGGPESGAERTSAVHRAFGGHLRGFDIGDEGEPSERANVVPLRFGLGGAPDPAVPVATAAAASVAPRGAEIPRTAKERWPMAVTALSAAAGFLLWWSLERANHSPMAAAPSVASEVGTAPGASDRRLANGPGARHVAAAPMSALVPASEPGETAPNAGRENAAERSDKALRRGAGVQTALGDVAEMPAAAGETELAGLAHAGAASGEMVPEEVVLEEEAEAPAKTNERGESLIPDDPRLRPAAEQTPVVQQPAVGAVQGAFGQVLPGARACVVGQGAPSRATVTFGSDGSVHSVVVEGPAKGTPADACIQRALGRARLAPFAKPSFSATTTVRP